MGRQDGPGSFSEGNTFSPTSGATSGVDDSAEFGVSGNTNFSSGGGGGGGDSDSGRQFIQGVIRDKATGNVTNPYPNSFFSRIFGAENVSYQNIIPQNTLNKLGGLAEQRFNNPQMAVSGGFGKLFGGAEGEMTIAGPRTAGIRPQTFTEGVGGLLASLAVPGGGMLERAGRTVYAPEGYLPEGYEQPEGGLLEQFLGGFGGLLQPEPETVGRAVGQAKDTAASLVDRARQGITSVLKDPVADDMVASVSAPKGESRADIVARTQQAVAPSNVTTILSGAPPFASMERKTLSPAEEASTMGMQTAEPINSLLDPNFEAQFGALKAANDEAIFNNRMFDRTRLR